MVEFIKNLFENNSQTALISLGITAVAHICFALAVYFDSKLNHIKYKTAWIIASALFGAFPTAIYFVFRRIMPTKVPIVCTRCGKKAPKNAKTCPKCGNTHFAPLQFENVGAMKTRIIALLAAAIVLFAFDTWYTQYSPWAVEEEDINLGEIVEETLEEGEVRFGYEENGKIVYYDREGKAYEDSKEVPFYDSEGNVYKYESTWGFVNEKDSLNDKIKKENALVDSNGYIVDAIVKFETVPDIVPFKTQDGTMYYSAEAVSWDKDGNMVYTSNGKIIH